MYFIKANNVYTSVWKILGVIIDNNIKKPEDLPRKLSRNEVLEKFSTKLLGDESLYVEAMRPGVFVIFSEKTTDGARATHATLSRAAESIICTHVSQYWLLPMYRDWRNFESMKEEFTFYKKANQLGIAWNQTSVVSQLTYDHHLSTAARIQQLHTRAERLSHIVPVFTSEDRYSITLMIDGELYTIDTTSSETMRTLTCIASSFKRGRR